MNSKELILLDLFSGIGGFPLGLHRAGFKFKKHYFSEIDKFAIGNYQYNFKNSSYVGPIENIKKTSLSTPDIVTFGSPCQDLSLAGKRKGLKGKKSKLFFEAIRILGLLQPRMFIFENVKGLFSSNKGKDFEVVLRAFADLGLYDLQWQLLNTSWILPQNRERIYLVGSLRTKPRPQVFPIPKNYQAFTAGIQKTIAQANIAATIDTRVGESGTYAPYIFTTRKRDTKQNIEFRKDQNVNTITGSKKANYLASDWKPMRSSRSEKAKKIRAANIKKGVDYAPFRERQFEVRHDGKFGTLTSNSAVDNLLTDMESIRRLTPLECERLQGFPDNWTKFGIINGQEVELSDSRRYQLIGNAVSVPIVQTVGVPLYQTFFPNNKTMNLATTTLDAPLDGLGKADMKTPITYYGGKQNMSKLIVSLIPDHNLYCEPFVGGAAVFFAKPPSPVEVINDLNGEVVNFYQMCKSEFNKLNKKIQATPHSRQLHRESADVLNDAENHTPIERAWAFWVQTNMSFSARMFGGYAYERKSNSTVKRLFNKKMAFTKDICARLDLVDLESNDAIKVIESRDTSESFFYIDPPYFNSDMGHYGGYTEKDFVVLLTTLGKLKGKFLLSSYPSNILTRFTNKYKWKNWSKKSSVSVTKDTKKSKTEVLTANYDFRKMMPEELSGVSEDVTVLVMRARAIKLRMVFQIQSNKSNSSFY